ncbi:hypothetical protein HHJ78_10980 [Mobiluncus mulieris]|uniref:Uncharacterized protein n=1 Tax=Mobiluncus mulieris TaxID=2052 RepID=A0A7Y0U334_9ACTO|nr:hypothetical protein [Mobiluncus mulieris]NMW66008.1 hypothetical protein [Mobiluncus mulieris]
MRLKKAWARLWQPKRPTGLIEDGQWPDTQNRQYPRRVSGRRLREIVALFEAWARDEQAFLEDPANWGKSEALAGAADMRDCYLDAIRGIWYILDQPTPPTPSKNSRELDVPDFMMNK